MKQFYLIKVLFSDIYKQKFISKEVLNKVCLVNPIIFLKERETKPPKERKTAIQSNEETDRQRERQRDITIKNLKKDITKLS